MKKEYKEFILEVIKANKELKYYINNKLTKNDFLGTEIVGEGGDKTKNIDLIAEKIFIKHLIKFCDIFSEENGLIKSTKPLIKNSNIILDPLDGSDNFVSSFPYYGTSVSLCIDKKTVIGFVYNLITGKYIFKTPYETNLINHDKKSNFGIFERAYTAPNITAKLLENNLKFRSPGATALSLASAIDYQFFLFAGKPRIFDIDAGLFISKDLNIYQNDKFLLVSRDQIIFEIIKDIIKGY